MNDTFEIKRLSRLIKYELINYMPKFFKSLLIFASVIVAVWIFSLTADIPVMPSGRVDLVRTLFVLAIILSPFIVYKNMNNRKKGYIYAMIPASTLEKLLSMIVLCVVVVPVLSYVVLTATDLLLWLFNKIGAGSFCEMAFYNPFADTMAYSLYFDDESGCLLPFFDGLLYIVYPVSYTIMFNTIFRKNKVMKTILFNIAVVFTLVILALMNSGLFEEICRNIAPYFDSMTPVKYLGWMFVVSRCATVLLTTTFLTITYFRIKKVNY